MGWTSLSANHHLWSSVSGHIKYFISHVTSQNKIIERSGNFMSGSCSWYVTTFPSLVARDIVVEEI